MSVISGYRLATCATGKTAAVLPTGVRKLRTSESPWMKSRSIATMKKPVTAQISNCRPTNNASHLWTLRESRDGFMRGAV